MKPFKKYNTKRFIALNLGLLMLIYIGFAFSQADFDIRNWIDTDREACAVMFLAGILIAVGVENEL